MGVEYFESETNVDTSALAKEAKQDTEISKLDAILTELGQKTEPANQQHVIVDSSAAVPVTDNGGSLTVDGSVGITGSVAVTGPLTDTELRATPVPVSGTVTTSPSGTQNVAITSSVELEVKNDSGNPLTVSDSASEFWRIENKRYADTEEIRFDIPTSLVSGSIYVGIATDATATSAASWTVIRSYFDANGLPSRKRIRFNVVWDSRTSGWT